MLQINLFASLREDLGTRSIKLAVPEAVETVDQLVLHLIAEYGSSWRILQDETRVLVALDQSVVNRSSSIRSASEVAFFPPMTGG